MKTTVPQCETVSPDGQRTSLCPQAAQNKWISNNPKQWRHTNVPAPSRGWNIHSSPAQIHLSCPFLSRHTWRQWNQICLSSSYVKTNSQHWCYGPLDATSAWRSTKQKCYLLLLLWPMSSTAWKECCWWHQPPFHLFAHSSWQMHALSCSMQWTCWLQQKSDRQQSLTYLRPERQGIIELGDIWNRRVLPIVLDVHLR